MRHKLILASCTIALTSCAAFRGPPGPKVYDNAFINIATENTIQVVGGQDFLRAFGLRLTEFTTRQMTQNGDLKAAGQCGPGTMKVLIDIISIKSDSSTSMGFLWFSGVATTAGVTKVAANIKIQDCTTGAVLRSDMKTSASKNVQNVLEDLASSAVGDAYKYQHRKM